jgi:hypothetical protein
MTAAVLERPCPPPSTAGCAVLSRYYAAEFAWPTAADATGVWLRLGDVVDALIMREAVAAKVNARLVQCLLGAPVIELTNGDWIFLTQRRTPLRQSTWDHLARIPVGWRQPGTALRLPRADEPACDVRWRHHPVAGAPLPPWTAVVSAIRTVAPL